MLLLILFAFTAGIVTILSPCILPILPLVLSGTLTGGKRKPLGIVTGFILSFTIFTLFLSTIVRATGISPDALRTVAIVMIGIFGLSLIIPALQVRMEMLFSKLANLTPRQSVEDGFIHGILVGISLGLLWTPCVGPILASVISLALSGTVTASAFFITLAYAIGTAIPLLAITYGGRNLLNKIPWLLTHSASIQKTFGVLMIATAIAIYLNVDRTFQSYILQTFPSYGTGLTKIEDNTFVKNALSAFQQKPTDTSNVGKPMNELMGDVGKAPDFIGGQQWFNSEPLTVSQLKGKVVLVDFWTYTCINCIRTLPYLKNWYKKYSDKGLVIIGVHTPEFEFEKEATNVAKAIKDFSLTYPIVQDNNYAIWNAYDNHYWPAHYLIDKNGKIRDTHFGEGAYDETEKKIVELLNETGKNLDVSTIENPLYTIHAQTPETYVGYGRLGSFMSPEQIQKDVAAPYTAPAIIPSDSFAYDGVWNVGIERSMPSTGASLTFRFNATEAFLVMRPIHENASGKVEVYLDGKRITSDAAGADVEGGRMTVDADRLYSLVKLATSGEHVLQLHFLDANLELYAFTFG